MNDSQAEDEIVERLARGARRNEVIEELCLERGLSWKEAEETVTRVAQKNAWRIARRQVPYWILLSLAVLLAGLVLVYYALASWLEAIWSQVLVPGDVMPIFTDTFWLTIHYPQLAFGVAVTAAGVVALRRLLKDLQNSGR
jgi:hypothetical protein